MRLMILLLLVALFVPGCSRDKGDKNKPAAATPTPRPPLVHVPQGGTTIRIATSTATMEFVHDSETGDLTAYIYDAYTLNRIRLQQETISLTLKSRDGDGATGQLVLGAVDDFANGERRGDASKFAAASDFLKGRDAFDVTVAVVQVGDDTLTDMTFYIQPEKDAPLPSE